MSREKQLLKNTLIVAIGQFCTKLITFFMLPFYTAYLSTTEYGIVDLFQTIIQLIIPLVFLQFDQAIFRFLIDIRKNEKNIKTLISTVFLTVLIITFGYTILFIFISFFINNDYKFFLLFNVIFTMFSNLLLQTCRGLGDNTTYSKGSIVTGAGTVILNVLFIAVLKFGVYGMLSATLIANFLCCVYVFVKMKLFNYISLKKYSKKILKELLKYSIPLVPNQLSWWIVTVSDRTIITMILGVAINGIYSAVNKFSTIIITLFNVFNLTWSESASLHFNDEDSSIFFNNVLDSCLRLFTCLCLSLIACMPFVFGFLIVGKEYASGYYQVPILLLSTLFNILVALFGSIYVALKKSKEVAKTSFFAAVINIVVNLLLIKNIGLYAASLSTLAGYLSMTIYRYIDVQKYIKIRFNYNFIISALLVTSIIIAFYYLNNIVLSIISLIIAIVFSFYYCFELMKNLFIVLINKIGKKKKLA